MDGTRAYDDEEFVGRALQKQEAAGLGEKGPSKTVPLLSAVFRSE